MEKEYMLFNGKNEFDPQKFQHRVNESGITKQQAFFLTKENIEKIAFLQDKNYAQGTDSILIIFQAMDAGGKDSMIKNVMSGLNPQSTEVTCFKKPTGAELNHDYLWRCIQRLPKRGTIGIFNRSYYEDVLIGRVHNLPPMQKLPLHCLTEDIWEKRYKHIKNFEEYLQDNGTIILKFYLDITKEEQKKRFLERIDNPKKNWKFESADFEERKHWDTYQKVTKEAINKTATPSAPWHVIPADKKWYARLAVSEFILEAFEKLNPEYPELPKIETEKLQECKKQLLEEH